MLQKFKFGINNIELKKSESKGYQTQVSIGLLQRHILSCTSRRFKMQQKTKLSDALPNASSRLQTAVGQSFFEMS